MQKCIVGKKIGMTQLFDESGKMIPVTVVEAGPCVVVQKKTTENDGYEAVQIGFGDISEKAVNKPLKGHFAKAGVALKRVLREFRLDDCSALSVGDIIKADTFAVGDAVDVAGVSKGACSSPSRVFKGKGLPGHMGAENVTVQNLSIVKIDAENNLIAIRGAIPGAKGGVVFITDSVKA